MLLQFSVENFLSFDELTHFSMQAGSDDDHPDHIVGNGELRAVKGAAIYGANAAGKSNLIAAMEFSRHLILAGVRPGENIGNRPFAFGSNAKRPTRFDWIVRFEGVLWSYSLSIEGARVVAESLYARGENETEDSLLFERGRDEEKRVTWAFGELLRSEKDSRQAQILDFVAEGCRAEQPFVAEALERNVPGLYDFHRWFVECLHIITPKRSWGGKRWSWGSSTFKDQKAFEPVLINNDQFNLFLSEFLRFADTGIERVRWDKEPLTPESISSLDETVKGFFDTLIGGDPKGSAYFVSFPDNGLPFMVQVDAEGARILTPKAIHIDAQGEEHPFAFDQESAGTRRLLQLVPWLFRLYATPTVLVIDELDQHLHTLLAREFVKFALDSNRNAGGQVIFTTHDTNLLDSWLLRRDEVWFVQKNEGRSMLSRLSEWDVKEGTEWERAYLLGRFEGRPFFGFSPALQGLHVPSAAKPPTQEELQGQLSEVT